MNTIQIVLLVILFLFGFWIYVKDFVPWLKILAVAFILVGTYFIIFPENANTLANFLQVGRGADLMLYFFVVIFSFSSIAMYQKIKNMERLMTQFFREKAKKEGINLGNKRK